MILSIDYKKMNISLIVNHGTFRIKKNPLVTALVQIKCPIQIK